MHTQPTTPARSGGIAAIGPFRPFPDPTTLATGEEDNQNPTTLLTGEEGAPALRTHAGGQPFGAF
jgi:hypothetical protein